MFLGEVLKISGELQSHPRGGAHLPAPSPKIRPCLELKRKHLEQIFIGL